MSINKYNVFTFTICGSLLFRPVKCFLSNLFGVKNDWRTSTLEIRTQPLRIVIIGLIIISWVVWLTDNCNLINLTLAKLWGSSVHPLLAFLLFHPLSWHLPCVLRVDLCWDAKISDINYHDPAVCIILIVLDPIGTRFRSTLRIHNVCKLYYIWI